MAPLLLSPVDRLQRLVGNTLRAKVAGEDADTRARAIWGTNGPRWFSPGDAIAIVHGDAAMFPGGIASLLLQSLHPLAMAGVAGHSGYKSDPWGRLQRTSNYLATTTYGTIEAAEEVIDRVRSIHRQVRGKDHRGRPYRADDPHLLSWVHVAEITCFLTAHQRFGAQRLTAAQADDYVAQAGLSAGRLGVLDPPRSVAQLDQQLQDFRPELEASPAAREAARFLLLHPPLAIAARPGYGMLAAGGLSLLPVWARDELAIPLPEPVARWVAAPVGHLGTAAVRWAMAGVEEHRNQFAPETGAA